MKTELELLKFSKDVSQDYVSRGTALNTSLKKIAQAHNLNAQEIKRVAEQANTETYLSMVGPSKDKYVEFPVANAEQVISDLSIKTAGLEEFNLFEEPVLTKVAEVEFSFALLGDEYKDMDKDLAVSTRYEEIAKERAILEERELIKKANDLAHEIDRTYTDLYNYIKNELAQTEVTFDEVASYIKTANFQDTENLLELLKMDLQGAFPIMDFTKEAQVSTLELVTDSPLYSKLQKLDNLNTELAKYAKLGLATKIGIGALASLGLAGTTYLAGHVNGRKAAGFGNLNKGSAIAAMEEANKMR